MTESSDEILVGANAVASETIILSSLSLVVSQTSTNWQLDSVFLIIIGILWVVFLIRVMAGMANNPNLKRIKSSLQWSSRLLDVLIIAALAGISTYITTYYNHLEPVIVFMLLAVILVTGSVAVDLGILGEYITTWKRLIYEETQENQIGYLLRAAADFAEDERNKFSGNQSTGSSLSWAQVVIVSIGLLSILSLATFPIWIVLAVIFGTWWESITVVLCLLVLRDMTRYIYIRYGAASELSDLRLGVNLELIWTIIKGVLIALTLGYITFP